MEKDQRLNQSLRPGSGVTQRDGLSFLRLGALSVPQKMRPVLCRRRDGEVKFTDEASAGWADEGQKRTGQRRGWHRAKGGKRGKTVGCPPQGTVMRRQVFFV